MTVSERDFLIILKNCIHPDTHTPLLCDSVDWNEIFAVTLNQNLFPLIYDAAGNYPSFREFDESHPELMTRATLSLSNQIRNTDEFLNLYKQFLNNGLAPVVMKEIICRELYGEKADLRPSGDEDILIEKDEYEKAEEVLVEAGYIKEDKEFDSTFSHMQEVTFTSSDSNLVIELHINPFGYWDDIRTKMNNWFRKVFSRTVEISVSGVHIRTMAPTDHLLFLVFHAFKHFIGKGFGIRLLLDTLLYTERYYDGIDWDYIFEGLRDVGAESFFSDMIVIGNEYLGFQIPALKTPVSPDALLDDMLQVGIFGNSTKENAASGAFMNIAVGGKPVQNDYRIKSVDMFHLLFPSWRTWLTLRPYLADRPWMLPVEWCKRVGRYLKKKDKVDYTQSWNIAERRLELLKKYGVI